MSSIDLKTALGWALTIFIAWGGSYTGTKVQLAEQAIRTINLEKECAALRATVAVLDDQKVTVGVLKSQLEALSEGQKQTNQTLNVILGRLP